MRKSWLLCVLSATLAWGQAAPGTPPPQSAAPAQPSSPHSQAPGAPMGAMNPGAPKAPAAPDTAAQLPPTTAVITIQGVCPAHPNAASAKPAAATGTAAKSGASAKPASASKTPAADCKTVITKTEFEKLAAGLSPNMTPQLKRQLANLLPRLLAMSSEAQKQGLDKTPQFAEAVKFYKMQILTQQLQHKIQDDASKVTDAEIQKYYDENPEAYEQYNLDRLFVPRAKQPEAESKEDQDKDEKLTDEQKKAKEDEEKAKADASEQEMTKLADTLRARAAAGEDVAKLQKEAFDAAGMKIESPTVNLPKVRRTALPPAHAAVFDLKAGEVSQVISDNGGHYIYKVVSKEELPLAQVKDEIHGKLQSEHTKEAMDKVNSSFKAETNDAYFGPPTPGTAGPPPRRIPNPRMAPGPTTPQAPPPGAGGNGQPTPAQPPASQTPPAQTPPPSKPN